MYLDQWAALSGRIRGLMRVAELDVRYLTIRSSDTYRRGERIGDEIEDILRALRGFRESFERSLPRTALDAMDRTERCRAYVTDTSGGRGARQERLWSAVVMLGAFETEMTYLLTDSQETIRARSELAFAHLQRLIVVDEQLREKWQAAYAAGEVPCEKLGAVHLLQHGIWAFKVDAVGERTDLVYQDRAGDLSDEQQYIRGFVQTEWKKVTESSDSERQFQQARAQAQRYAQGALGGSELADYRYLVVVSEQQVERPHDLNDGGIMYRHINIAVDPETPSRTNGNVASTGSSRCTVSTSGSAWES